MPTISPSDSARSSADRQCRSGDGADASCQPTGGSSARVRAALPLTGEQAAEELSNERPDSFDDRFKKIFEMSPVVMTLSDPQREVYIDVNRTFLEKFGFERDEVLGRSGTELGIFPDPGVRNELYRLMATDGCIIDREVTLRAKQGHALHLIFSSFLLETSERTLFLSTAVDIGSRVRAEAESRALAQRLAQAQRLEAVGRLAGGVAHDFNNMLTVIQGNVELALGNPQTPAESHQALAQVVEACERSSELTRQLLTFARQGSVHFEVVDLNDTIERLLKLLRRLIGEHIELVWRPTLEPSPVRVDGPQIDQVLINLCINARDAIDDVGSITIETANVSLSAEDCAEEPLLAPGHYVRLTVGDTGRGMDVETQGKLFEPFFTTKDVGRGTGLGLATVHGIVEQHEGFIRLSSEPGQGTRFQLYFPRHDAVATKPSSSATEGEPSLAGCGETILLVEDEPAILRMERALLERAGYVVVSAPGPLAAERLVESRSGPIHLLITDVVMPDMNGRDLSERLAARVPGLQCLFVSGYSEDVFGSDERENGSLHFLSKPFSRSRLLTKVKEILSEPAGGGRRSGHPPVRT